MEVGWKQIWILYGWRGLFSRNNKIFYFSLLISLIAVSCVAINSSSVFVLINKVIGLCISIMPTLLGFNLGAYALIIGFLSNKRLLDALVKKNDADRFDRLQRISGIFAINIITQAFTLLCAFLLQIFLEIGIPTTNLNFHCIDGILIINLLTFFIMFLLTLYSVALLIQNAINIFDFSQLFSHFVTKDIDEK